MKEEIETYSMSVEEEKDYYKELYQEKKAQVQAFMHYRELYTIMSNRINKAIEYIMQHKLDRKPNTTTRLEAFTMQERDLLNILQGSDKE